MGSTNQNAQNVESAICLTLILKSPQTRFAFEILFRPGFYYVKKTQGRLDSELLLTSVSKKTGQSEVVIHY